MDRLKSFLFTTLLGGVTVILPGAILAAVFGWLFSFVTGLIQPFTNFILARSELKEIIADLIVISIILGVCFSVGLFVRTGFGQWLFYAIESKILRVAPGYNLIKETILQLLGSKKSPFSSVALAQLFENNVLTTVFVTDEHENGYYTVFVPTGPNPTSGLIYHLKSEFVHLIDVPVEDAMRSIISCGRGSTKLLDAYKKKLP